MDHHHPSPELPLQLSDEAEPGVLDVDFVALSFVQGPEELQEARELITSRGGRAGLVAKIERRQAPRRLGPIVVASDALMAARVDLGIEVGLERVPEA